jgi:hypothetical protein
MTALPATNLVLRVAMETGIVLGIGYWGFVTGEGAGAKLLLGVAVPLVTFGFWGLVDFRAAGHAGEWLRLVQELVISGLAALALYAAGRPALAWVLAGISVVHHALVYATGSRLLKPKR